MKKINLLSTILFWIVQSLAAQNILMNNNNPETITCGNTYIFYDAGGASNPYSSGVGATYIKTFTPSISGQKIRIDFYSFDVENHYQVYMQIFNGPDTTYPLIGQYSGNNSPGTVYSTAANGELTILFTHDNYQGGYQGWEAQIFCQNAITPPTYDEPCTATLLPTNFGSPTYQLATLIGATNSTNNTTILNPNCSNYNNGPDVWFKAVVPSSGNLTFITNDSTIYDTGIEVYSGNCNSLLFVGCDNDGNSNSLFGTMSKLTVTGQNPGDTLFVRIWKSNGGMGLFNIAAYEPIPSIQVLYPNGGEVLLQNDYVYIDFTTEAVDTVSIEFSDNNGTSWTHISNWPISNGYFGWTVPNITSTQCLIRVSQMGNPTLFDVSDDTFAISGPYIQVNSPNGGETYASEQVGVEITWDSPGFNGNVNILLSSNNGASWISLANNIYSYGYYNVDFPNISSNQCLIKIEDSNNPGLFDVSDATFTITNIPPTITILNPVGGEVYTEGQSMLINWTSSNVTAVDILFSDGDGGGTIALNFPANQNYYYWQIPIGYNLGNSWQIIIQPVNSPWFSQSSSFFTVQAANPSITLNNPCCGNNYYEGSFVMIDWQSSQVSQHLIELSTSGNSGPWTTIANNVIGNTYYWQVPNTPSTNCYIRISDANNLSLFTISDAFSIITPPGNSNSITVQYDGPISLCPGDNFNVIFNASGVYGTLNEFYAQLSDANGSFINPIPLAPYIGTLYNDTINCTLPNNIPNGSGYRVRVVASDYPTISSASSTGFSVNIPDADFIANTTNAIIPTFSQINFTFNGNTTGITSYNWNFGDGGTSNLQNPSYNYTSQGFYNVSLTTSNGTCTNTKYKPFYITVDELFDTDTIVTLTGQDILGLAFVNAARGCFALANGTCLITQDSGLTFTTVPVGLSTALTSASLVTGFWLVTSVNGNVAISTNGGTTWTVQNVGSSDSLFASAFLDNTNGYVVGNNGKIFKYNGSSWSLENSGTTNSLRGVAFANTDIITVGYNGTILRSTGNGVWTPRTSPFNSHYRSVAFNDAGVGIAVGDLGRIIKSTDNGLTWSVALSGIPNNFTSVAISGDSVWAVANGGIIYKSFNAGNTWIRNTIGVQNNLNGITFYGDEQLRRMGLEERERAQASNRGYVVGAGGVARLFGNPIDTTGNSNSINELNNFNILFNVYPVPAINEIIIEGSIKQEGFVNISIKDMHGAIVKEINSHKENGIISKRISIADLAAGIYFVHINCPEQQSIHRIIVSK